MIRVLLCAHHLDYGGSQLSVHHWANHLDREKFEVIILAMGRGGLSEKFEAHYPVHYDGPGYPNLERFIHELKPDLVHACPGGGKDEDYITRAARLVPVTQTSMCPRPVGNLKDVAKSIVISDFVLGLQPEPENVIKIDLPFDVDEFDIAFDKKHFGLPEDKILVGSLGNARRENADFLKIARDFNHPDVHFVIRADLKYWHLRGRKRITILRRRLSEDEKMSFFHHLDIFMYPTSNEAYGNVFLEAMSQRVPIISYAESAMPEVIAGAGLLAPLHDRKRMMALLAELVEDPERRRRLGETGYRQWSERNHPRLIAKKYETVFEEAVTQRVKPT